MRRLTFLFSTLAFIFLFSGCGQSGPLYVPGNPSTMAVPPVEETADENDSEEEKDSSESPESH
jgi:predicted small lipoprotein YifL